MDPVWPQSRVGRNIVEFAEVGKQFSSGFKMDYLIVRFSPTGKVLSMITLDPALIFGGQTYNFSHIRAGLDGSLYYLQTSDKWGMRVARYSWAGNR